MPLQSLSDPGVTHGSRRPLGWSGTLAHSFYQVEIDTQREEMTSPLASGRELNKIRYYPLTQLYLLRSNSLI